MRKLRPWYWIVLFFWFWLAAMCVAAIHDYGIGTVTPLAKGGWGAVDALVSILVLTAPVWTYFLARRRDSN